MRQKSINCDNRLIEELAAAQADITNEYNSFAGESISKKLREEMLALLFDEHQILSKLRDETVTRGILSPVQADAQSIFAVKNEIRAAEK